MRKYKTVKEEVEREVETNMICDICGYDNKHYTDWENDPHEKDKEFWKL